MKKELSTIILAFHLFFSGISWAQGGLILINCRISPNPAVDSVHFLYQVAGASTIFIDIFDSSGKRVNRLSGNCVDGDNEYYWDLTDQNCARLAGGTYYYQIKAHGKGKTTIKKGIFTICP